MLNKKFVLLFVVLAFSFIGCKSKERLVEIEINNHIFYVEVAKTAAERERGLMYRKHLEDNRGMLFVFDRDQHLSFWMKNTYIPLSIAFLSKEGKILRIEDMKPLSEKIIESEFSARYALELPRGSFKKVGAKVGNFVKLPEDF